MYDLDLRDRTTYGKKPAAKRIAVSYFLRHCRLFLVPPVVCRLFKLFACHKIATVDFLTICLTPFYRKSILSFLYSYDKIIKPTNIIPTIIITVTKVTSHTFTELSSALCSS